MWARSLRKTVAGWVENVIDSGSAAGEKVRSTDRPRGAWAYFRRADQDVGGDYERSFGMTIFPASAHLPGIARLDHSTPNFYTLDVRNIGTAHGRMVSGPGQRSRGAQRR